MAVSRHLPLKDRQRAVVEQALRPPVKLLYTGADETKVDDQPPWQVLVVDAVAQDMLTALLNPRDLRRHGITLLTQIDAPRGAVPDAPVTYMVAPTPENIAWLLKDIDTRHLYERVSIAFTSSASRPLLAALAAQLTVPSPIARVLDLHTNFVALEQNLFSLAMRDSFVKMKAINDDNALAVFMQPIVAGLLSVCITVGLVPIIRAQRGGPAEAVAAALDAAIRDNLDLFAKETSVSLSSFRRPLLLLMDRDFDFNAMLYHTWTYQALVYDSFETRLNSVTLPPSGSQSATKYELDKAVDPFWSDNASSPLPEVAEGIEAALTSYRKDVETINQRAGNKENGEASTSALATAVASLPELAERKHNIDVHTNIATAVLDEVSKRALDTFFELETQIMISTMQTQTATSSTAADYKVALLELLKGVRETSTGEKRGAGTPEDRLRLFLIFYIAFGSQLSEVEVAQYRGALVSAGASLDAVQYVEKARGFRHDLVSAPSRTQPTATLGLKRAALKGMMTNVVNRGYRSIASVAQNAKNLVVENRRSLPCARVLQVFMSERARVAAGGSANDILDGYLFYDPKIETSDSAKRRSSGEPSDVGEKARRMLFSDAIIFVVGGGNYVEFEDCLSAVAPPSGSEETRNLLYGSTEMLSSKQFLGQMAAVHATRQ